MIIGETKPEFDDRLPGYNSISPDVPVGGLTVAQYREINEQAGDRNSMPPEMLYECAWLDLETTLAMMRESAPDITKAAQQKIINRQAEGVRVSFRSIARNSQLTAALRARAGMSLAGIDTYLAMGRGSVGYDSKITAGFATGVQRAATPLFESDEAVTLDDDRLARIMALAGIMAEFFAEQSWTTPAAPRQPWDINCTSRFSGNTVRISMTELTDEPVLFIPSSLLDTPLWDSGLLMMATYAQHQPRRRGSPHAGTPVDYALLGVSEHIRLKIKGHQEKQTAAAAEAQSDDQEQSSEPRTEIAWYLGQSACDFVTPDYAGLQRQTVRLEKDHQAGRLSPQEMHVLGWMQLDHAIGTASKAWEELMKKDTAPAEKQSGYEFRASQYIMQAKTRFQAALNTMLAAAQEMRNDDPANYADAVLGAAAIPLYQELYTDPDQQQLPSAINRYLRQVAALYTDIRNALQRFRNDPELMDALEDAATRTCLCLLVTGAAEETSRHLVLTKTPRRGNVENLDAIAVPLNYINGKYETQNAVGIRFTDGSKIMPGFRFLDIGYKLLEINGKPMPLLAELAAAVRGGQKRSSASSKGGHKKSKVPKQRSPQIDELSTKISDGIIDAAEADPPT